MAILNSTSNAEMAPTISASDGIVSDENRKVLDWIAQLMKPETRETALLELSKKREQVPELALILWHSFGERPQVRKMNKHRVRTILIQAI